MMKRKNILLSIICILPLFLSAEVKLNALFANGMVLQQDSDVPIWGWADPKEEIIIKANWGATAETVTLADGTWRVNLKTPKAGGPFEIVVQGKNKRSEERR